MLNTTVITDATLITKQGVFISIVTEMVKDETVNQTAFNELNKRILNGVLGTLTSIQHALPNPKPRQKLTPNQTQFQLESALHRLISICERLADNPPL